MTGVRAVASPAHDAALSAALREWIPRQRWFGGKARTVREVEVADVAVLEAGDAAVLDVLAGVRFTDGHAETYQVPLAAAGAASAEVVATIAGTRLVDVADEPAAALALLRRSVEAGSGRSRSGADVASAPVEGAFSPVPGPARRLGAEQSNSSIVYGNEVILKIFRKLERGANPDVEITRALTRAGFDAVPAQHGALELRDRGGDDEDVVALTVVADFVAGGREGWDLATGEVRRLTGGSGEPPGPGLADELRRLGTAVGALHAALRDAFGSRPAGDVDRKGWVEAMREQVDAVLRTAEQRAPAACGRVLQRRAELEDRLALLAADTAPAPLTRTHGDLHLGQVLLDPRGRWQLLDFEGEPARPLRERRALHPPLRDVAGMLRSFDYAAAAGSGGDLSDVPRAAQQWRDQMRGLFVDAYVDVAGAAGVLPPGDAAVAAHLDAFELDKAVYELGYELANRPDWVPIPVGGILRVLDRGSGG